MVTWSATYLSFKECLEILLKKGTRSLSGKMPLLNSGRPERGMYESTDPLFEDNASHLCDE